MSAGPEATPLQGGVALVTGAARGQGRSHALAFAAAGADVAICDAESEMPTIDYPLAHPGELASTAELLEAQGVRCLAERVDVRDLDALEGFAAQVAEQLGGVDFLIANAGVYSFGASTWELTAEQWQAMLDINLTGVWNTCRAAVPAMLSRGGGGSIAMISSVNGFEGVPGTAHYCAAKHGLLGLMRTMAIELAPSGIRVNTVHPTAVDTKMVDNDVTPEALAAAERYGKDMSNLLPVEKMEPRDVSEALLWLCSPAARYVTGTTFTVDAGFGVK